MHGQNSCPRWLSHILCERRRTIIYAISRMPQLTITSSSTAPMGSILIRSGRRSIGSLPLSRRNSRGWQKRYEDGTFTNLGGRDRRSDDKHGGCALCAGWLRSTYNRRTEGAPG